MPQLAWKDPKFADVIGGGGTPERQGALKQALHQQRNSVAEAFKREFVQMVKDQMRYRGVSQHALARRTGIGLGTITRHFTTPTKMNSYYMYAYLVGLGLSMGLVLTPVENLEDFPGYVEKVKVGKS
jgi:hypothetical protein